MPKIPELLLRCSACREVKPESQFNRNRSSKRGRDSYCVSCRAAYYKNGRTWKDSNERAEELLASGRWRCSACRKEKPVEEFYKSSSYRYGISWYCKKCSNEKYAASYASPKGKARAREYNSRPEVKVRNQLRKEKCPRTTLAISLNRALKRRPTSTPITLDELHTIWKNQSGLCVVSGVRMTWGSGKGRGRMTPTSISLDRIDNQKGYISGNVRLVCYQVNAFRGAWTDEQMISMARAIVAKADNQMDSLTFVA